MLTKEIWDSKTNIHGETYKNDTPGAHAVAVWGVDTSTNFAHWKVKNSWG